MPIRAYHMSATLLAESCVLVPNGRNKVDAEIEQALEDRRPTDCLSRRDAVFSRPDLDLSKCGLSRGFLYEVELEAPQIHDQAWIGKLQASLVKRRQKMSQSNYLAWSPGLLDTIAGRYWSGQRFETPFLEFLTPTALVVKRLSDDLVRTVDTAGGWRPPNT